MKFWRLPVQPTAPRDAADFPTDEPPRAPPNAPPPEIHELQYVNELEFVHDPGPDEPVWSAD